MRFQTTAKLADIKIAANRQRRTFDPAALNELAESIKTHGLFHPIVTREELGQLWLVSGERRLRAVTDIYELGGSFRYDSAEVPVGEVPYVTLGELDSLAREEAELAENIHRTDLSFLERAQVTLRISTLRGAQAVATGAPAPTVAQVAEEVRGSSQGIHHEITRREIIVAKHAGDPDVQGAKTLDEAFKLLKRKEATAKNVSLAAEVGKTFTVAAHRALNEDSLVWLASCPADQFDVVLTDPPYGMGADEFGDSGGKAMGAHAYKDDEGYFFDILTVCEVHLFRIAKPQAHLYWFCDIDKFHLSRSAFERAGWWCHRTPIIWHKPAASRVPWPEHGPQRKWEMILYAVKGKRPVTKIYPDLITENPDVNLGHAAQKPVGLYSDLLRRSVRPGDTILDPFMGSGVVFPAAHSFSCKATGIDKDPASFGLALRRLEILKEQPDLLEGLL